MAEPLRYFTDEHFPGPVCDGLRRHGIDVLTAQEAGLAGRADSELLAFATAGERVMLTFDTDFLALHKAGLPHAGIVWCPQQKHTIRQLIRALLLVHGVLDREAMRNHVEHL